MITIPYIPAHYINFMLSQYQDECKHDMDANYMFELANIGESFSIIEGDDVLCIAGLVPCNKYRAEVWAIMSKLTKGKMIGVTRHVKVFLDRQNFDRMETCVKTDFKMGHKWAELLGFEYEVTMPKFAYSSCFDKYRRLKNG